ncbi:MAG: SDR family NAD(P)-dependent oxidoreductase, partial [Bacteroidota bacterium]
MANIIITGTSRGIGFEMVKQFADEGHQVLALSRNAQPILDLALENVTAFPFDLSSTESFTQLSSVLDSWKTVDILINNAGSLVNQPFLEMSMEDFEKVYQVNVFGVAKITQAVLPKMSKKGHVVT